MPPFGGVHEQGSTTFADELHTLIQQPALLCMGMAIGRHFDRAKVTDKRFGIANGKVGCKSDGSYIVDKAKQMLRGGAIAIDRVHAGALHLLMMFQPALAKIGNRHRIKAQDSNITRFQLRIGLRGQETCRIDVRPHPRPAVLTVFVVSEIPDPTPQIPLDFTHSKRRDHS